MLNVSVLLLNNNIKKKECKKEMTETKDNVTITTVTLNREKLEMARRRMNVSTASAALRRLVDLYLGSEGEEIEDEELRSLMEKKRKAEERGVGLKKVLLEVDEEVAKLQREIFGKIPRQSEKVAELKESEKAKVKEEYVKKVNEFIKADPEYGAVWEFQSFVPEEVMEKYVGLHKGEIEELEIKNEKQMASWLLKATEGKLCVKVK